MLAVGLVSINPIGDSLALRQRPVGEAWSAAHPVDAPDRKPKPAFELLTPPTRSATRGDDPDTRAQPSCLKRSYRRSPAAWISFVRSGEQARPRGRERGTDISATMPSAKCLAA